LTRIKFSLSYLKTSQCMVTIYIVYCVVMFFIITCKWSLKETTLLEVVDIYTIDSCYYYNVLIYVSPLTSWVRIPVRRGVLNTTLCEKFISDLRQIGDFLQALRFSPPIKLIATIQLKYCWKLNTINLNPHYISGH